MVERPNMALARDLLHQGESAVVLEYFTRCADSWPRGKERLSAWAAEVEGGSDPGFRKLPEALRWKSAPLAGGNTKSR